MEPGTHIPSGVRVIVDADACPVLIQAAETANRFGLKCIAFCDASHQITAENEKYRGAHFSVRRVVSGADSVDFAIVSEAREGDIVATADCGLAAMCLGKRVLAVNWEGQEYTNENIDALLYKRHNIKKMIRSGKYPKAKAKRSDDENRLFVRKLEEMIKLSVCTKGENKDEI